MGYGCKESLRLRCDLFALAVCGDEVFEYYVFWLSHQFVKSIFRHERDFYYFLSKRNVESEFTYYSYRFGRPFPPILFYETLSQSKSSIFSFQNFSTPSQENSGRKYSRLF